MAYKGNSQPKKQYNPKSNKEDAKNNKKALMQKFVANTQKTSNDTTVKKDKSKILEVVKVDDSKYKEEIQRLKKQLLLEKEKRSKLLLNYKKLDEKIKKQSDAYELLQKEFDKSLKENEMLKDKTNQIQDLKDNIYNYKEELEKSNDIIENLKTKNEFYKSEISELNSLLNEDAYNNTINQLKGVIKEREITINYLNNQLKQSVFNNKLVAARVKISEVNSKEIAISDEVELIKPTIKAMKKNIKSIKFKIYNEVKAYQRKRKERKGNKKHGKAIYGVISKNGWLGYKFTTLEGKEYKVFRESMQNKSFVEGLTCLACINNKTNKAWVQYIYYREEDYYKDVEKRKVIRKKVQVKTSKKEEVDQLDFKVLIITALSTKKYTEKLRSSGIKVDYFNSYYENAKRLDSILSKYDMVFYCTKHSKHYCKDVINNQSDSYDKSKYYILANDSVNNIFNIIDERINSMIVDVEESKDE